MIYIVNKKGFSKTDRLKVKKFRKIYIFFGAKPCHNFPA